MPYGKYKGRQLLDLPEPYLVWYHGKGFPQSKLGAQMALIYEVKLNGLEGMLRRFQRQQPMSGSSAEVNDTEKSIRMHIRLAYFDL